MQDYLHVYYVTVAAYTFPIKIATLALGNDLKIYRALIMKNAREFKSISVSQHYYQRNFKLHYKLFTNIFLNTGDQVIKQ